jgi:hypothetical protein
MEKLWKIISKEIQSTPTDGKSVAFFQNGHNNSFAHCFGERSGERLRYRIYCRSSANFVEQPIILVPGVPSIATD